MASIHKEVLVAAPAEEVWAALRDVANPHRLFRGVLADARMEGDTCVVTFADGLVVRERIVALDDGRRRVAYAALREGLVHHSASMQVFAEGAGSSRFVWISDVLPGEAAASFEPLVDQGVAALKQALEDPDRRGGP